MTFINRYMLSTAAAALLSVPLAVGSAMAQQSGTQSNETQDTGTQGGAQASGADQSGQGAGAQQDVLVATVGGEEIRSTDIMTVLGMLSPELAAQPPEMLIPMAMEQLILRQLILAEARAQNLADDPEVISLVEGSMQAAEDDALVQVWIDREMQNAVTDEAVQQAYSDLQANAQQEVPPLEQVRPQIEQYLRQQSMQEIAMRLQQDAEIILYDAAGQPVERPQNGGGKSGSGTSGSGQATDGSATGSGSNSDASGTTQGN
ncbi:hypothetical protein [Jannaschia formosa]|uniref:hypothetical protein n=1 Tax=Jannaschia formosa TaxID=2259592 RepID=UPI000E1BD03A|nr:hypothetical protein [Jannaschia formosa]TFL17240.1 hypothetical protein DR046_15535 [Jannaschia formosa]